MSKRREEADLQRALRLSTQGSVPNSSAVISSSSPLQIPSGFKLAFQSESSPSTHQSGSSEFKGFQGGIFAGLQTPAGHRDSLGTVLSPTMAGPTGSRERPSVQKSASRDPNGKAMKMTSKDATVDVVEGSEDETEEELEQPAKPVSPPIGMYSAYATPLVTNNHPPYPLSTTSPLPFPHSETIGSFSASAAPNQQKSPPSETKGNANYPSSSIEGFTTSMEKSSSKDRPASSISLSKPTEMRADMSRPRPKKRNIVPDQPTSSGQDGLVDLPREIGAGSSGRALDPSSSGPSERKESTHLRDSVQPPPAEIKKTVVYSGRSIKSKKRKIFLSDSEEEEAESIPSTINDRPEHAGSTLESSASNNSGLVTNDTDNIHNVTKTPPNKKPKQAEPRNRSRSRSPKDGSIDPLDMDHVNSHDTPLGKHLVVEIPSARKEGRVPSAPSDADEEIVVQPAAKVKPATKNKRKVDVSFEDEDPFAGLDPDAAAVADSEEDDFVPPGKRAKASKTRKAVAKKEKKPPKGKRGTPAAVLTAEVSQSAPDPESELPENVDASVVPDQPQSTASTIIEAPEPVVAAKGKAARKKAPAKAKKGKGKAAQTPTIQSTNADAEPPLTKSAEFVESDDEQIDSTALKASTMASEAGTEATTVTATTNAESVKAVDREKRLPTGGKKSNSKAGVNTIESDSETECQVDKPKNDPSALIIKKMEPTRISSPGPALQAISPNIVLDTPTRSGSPSFVVGKDGRIIEFRTNRDDLPKVVANTGGVKRMGMSRSFRIPSLHRNLKEPPKRLPPAPKKPEKKKKDDEECSDEEPVDEFGRPKPKPGSKEWYMMED